MRLAPLLLLALLAGCVALPEAPTPPAAGAPGNGVLAWELIECTYVVGWSDADPAALQARVPEGFTVGGGSLFGLVDTATSILGTESFVCASGTGLDGDLPRMEYGSLWFPVTPSEAYVLEGVETYYWKEDILVPDAPRRAYLEARGVPVRAGSATLHAAAASPLGAGGTLALDDVGDLGLSMDVVRELEAPSDTLLFAELSPAEGGVAVWASSYQWSDAPFAQGRGTISWPAGHWSADAVGGTLTPGTFHAGTWSFRGNVTLPRPGT